MNLTPKLCYFTIPDHQQRY